MQGCRSVLPWRWVYYHASGSGSDSFIVPDTVLSIFDPIDTYNKFISNMAVELGCVVFAPDYR